MSIATKHFVAPFEIKSFDDEAGTFEGYGAVFGNVDSYGDIIVKGAFANHLVGNEISKDVVATRLTPTHRRIR
jgi:phage head maturation protease